MRHRLVYAEFKSQHRRAHHSDVLGQGRTVKAQRARIVLPLVAGKLRAQPNNAVLAAVRAGVLRRADGLLARCAAFRTQAIGVEVQALSVVLGVGPDRIADPAPVNAADAGAGPLHFHDVGAKRRVLLDAGLRAFEPAVPPAQRLLQKADARFGHGKVRVLMRPRADDALHRALHRSHQTRHRIGIGVVPAAKSQYRRFDGTNVFVHRTALPISVAVRVLQPVDGQQRLGVQALQPHGAPGVAHQRRVRRARGITKHGGRPAHVLGQEAAAFVVDVVGIAVVGGAQGDDGFQAFGLARCHLQAVKATPGDAHHAHAPGAPRLLAQPGNHRFGVLQFLLGIFVEHQALRIAIAAHIHANAGVAMAREIRVGKGVAHDGAVAFAVG